MPGRSAGRCSCSRRCGPAIRGRRTGSTSSSLDGMRDNAARVRSARASATSPTSSPRPATGRGLLEALAADAAVVVTDDFPVLLPAADGRRGAARRLPRAARGGGRQRPAADARRRPRLADRVGDAPPPAAHARRAPRRRARRPTRSPGRVPRRAAGAARRASTRDGRMSLAWRDRGGRLDAPAHRVTTWRRPRLRGGAGGRRGPGSRPSSRDGLAGYLSGARDAARDAGSGLSPYLHFGHLSAHDVFAAVMWHEGWLGALPRARQRGAGRLVGRIAGRRGLPRSARHVARARLQHVRAPPRLRRVRRRCRRGRSTRCGRHAGDRREHVYTRGGAGRRRRPTTRCGTPPSGSSCARGASTPICACCGARRSCSGRRPPKTRWRR